MVAERPVGEFHGAGGCAMLRVPRGVEPSKQWRRCSGATVKIVWTQGRDAIATILDAPDEWFMSLTELGSARQCFNRNCCGLFCG